MAGAISVVSDEEVGRKPWNHKKISVSGDFGTNRPS